MVWHFDDSLPIYTQLITHIKFAIVSGELPPGQRMSTVRELSAEAGVNPNTMQRAFQELEREGLVYSQRSSGRFVTEDRDVIDSAKLTLAKQYVSDFISTMRRIDCDRETMIALLEGAEKEETV